MNIELATKVTEKIKLGDTASADTRYTFTVQFLQGSAIFVRRLRKLEQAETWSEEDQTEHRALASAVVMQCAAALETETHEVAVHGPGAHLGSNGVDSEAQRFLEPIAAIIDRQSTLDRFALILHLLEKGKLNTGAESYENASLVVRLRNEITHYKSLWGEQMERSKLFSRLESKHHRPPPFTDPSMNFFPLRCLSADCAEWALSSTVAFLEHFYVALGVPSRFLHCRDSLNP